MWGMPKLHNRIWQREGCTIVVVLGVVQVLVDTLLPASVVGVCMNVGQQEPRISTGAAAITM
eukprot:5750369-Amphidinium_carterae.1